MQVPLRRTTQRLFAAEDLDMQSIPFTIPHLYGGLVECHGLIRGETDSLVLEFQVQDGVAGVFRRKPRTVRIPLADLASVELRKGWFSRTLVIQARSLLSVADVPANRHGKIELRIAKPDTPAAERLVAGLYE